ncbi:MAG: WYL domain-containing protein, partial [Gemmatimonadales bacterium]
MADLAQRQVQRLVTLVAWMSQGDRDAPVTWARAARRLGVSVATLRRDLQALLTLTDGQKPWLLSLQYVETADGFMLGSLGAFRRPLRLTGDEVLALVLGLAATRGGRALARRLAAVTREAPDGEAVARVWAIGPTPGEALAGVLAVARRARDEGRRLELTYCGSSGEPSARVVQVAQVIRSGGQWYLIAWCERAAARRHFRAERVLSARLLEEGFAAAPGSGPVAAAAELFTSDRAVEGVVAFSPRIARWIRERYPEGTEGPDGRYQVRFRVADPRWLAREVLQYG